MLHAVVIITIGPFERLDWGRGGERSVRVATAGKERRRRRRDGGENGPVDDRIGDARGRTGRSGAVERTFFDFFRRKRREIARRRAVLPLGGLENSKSAVIIRKNAFGVDVFS